MASGLPLQVAPKVTVRSKKPFLVIRGRPNQPPKPHLRHTYQVDQRLYCKGVTSRTGQFQERSEEWSCHTPQTGSRAQPGELIGASAVRDGHRVTQGSHPQPMVWERHLTKALRKDKLHFLSLDPKRNPRGFGQYNMFLKPIHSEMSSVRFSQYIC